jgi:hypothetical protein
MRIRTKVCAGAITTNHNAPERLKIRTRVRAGAGGDAIIPNHNAVTRGMKIRTKVRAGAITTNHSAPKRRLKVRTQVCAGGLHLNHNARCA